MFLNACNFLIEKKEGQQNKINVILRQHAIIIYILTIIPRARVGYEMIDSQRGA